MVSKTKEKTYSILGVLAIFVVIGILCHAFLFFIYKMADMPLSLIIIRAAIYLVLAAVCMFIWFLCMNKISAYYEKQIEDEAAEEHERYIQAIKEGYKFYIHGQEVEPDKIVEGVYELVYDNEQKIVMGY